MMIKDQERIMNSIAAMLGAEDQLLAVQGTRLPSAGEKRAAALEARTLALLSYDQTRARLREVYNEVNKARFT